MSTAFHLANEADLAPLDALVTAFHAEMGVPSETDRRQAGLTPLLQGSPYGAVYLLGPRRAPVGYLVITFGWSLTYGGMEAYLEELFIRPSVRKRGMASDALLNLPKALEKAGVFAIHLTVDRDATNTQKFFQRVGFTLRDRSDQMTHVFS